MAERSAKDITRDDLLHLPRLHPSPRREVNESPPVYAVPPGQVTIDQYLALRQVPEHRRAARRAFAGAVRLASVAEFDRLFSGVSGQGR